MSLIRDFKTFAVKGNLADVAIAFVLGAGFNKVITSFTEGIVSPIIGMLSGKDLNRLKWIYQTEVKEADKIISPEIAIKYGTFIGAIFDFILIAFVCFLFIKWFLKKDPNALPAPTPSEVLLTEIRDLLKK